MSLGPVPYTRRSGLTVRYCRDHETPRLPLRYTALPLRAYKLVLLVPQMLMMPLEVLLGRGRLVKVTPRSVLRWMPPLTRT